MKRQSGLAIVAAYWFPYQAHLARSLLESEGVPAWVLDEFQVQQQWHMAGPLGGVKVGVPPGQEARARSILARDHESLLAELPESEHSPIEGAICPRCGAGTSREIEEPRPPSATQAVVVVLALVFGALVPWRRHATRRRCAACGHVYTAARRDPGRSDTEG